MFQRSATASDIKCGAKYSERGASDNEWGEHSPVGEWVPDRHDTQVALNDVQSGLEGVPLFRRSTS